MPRAPIAPGRLIDIGSHRLHIHRSGSGEPPVVFDAALGGSSLSWTVVQPAVADFTTACSYNRAGFGWSEAGPEPRTVSRIADELDSLLTRAAVRPPYVLVGHSFGALTMRVFAARHPTSIAGLVFIDPAHPEDWVNPNGSERARIARGAQLCRHGTIAARLGIASIVSSLVSAGALSAARRIASFGGPRWPAALGRGGARSRDEASAGRARSAQMDVDAATFLPGLRQPDRFHLHQRRRSAARSGLRQPAARHDFRDDGERRAAWASGCAGPAIGARASHRCKAERPLDSTR